MVALWGPSVVAQVERCSLHTGPLEAPHALPTLGCHRRSPKGCGCVPWHAAPHKNARLSAQCPRRAACASLGSAGQQSQAVTRRNGTRAFIELSISNQSTALQQNSGASQEESRSDADKGCLDTGATA